MIAKMSYYNVSAHGGKLELKDCLVMTHDVVDGGSEYDYGPGETLVSEEPVTEQEKIEQIAHLSEMKRRMRMFGGLTNG